MIPQKDLSVLQFLNFVGQMMRDNGPNHDLQTLRLVLAVERVAAAPDSALVHPRQVLARAAHLLLVVRHPGLVGVLAAACRITNKQI